jgi:hypothetical protein
MLGCELNFGNIAKPQRGFVCQEPPNIMIFAAVSSDPARLSGSVFAYLVSLTVLALAWTSD